MIKKKALDKEIESWEKGKKDTRKLDDLYRQRVALRNEISAVAAKL